MCDPSGLTLLHLVMRKCDGSYGEKRKMFGLFFDFLLLNGADYKKRGKVKDRYDGLKDLPSIEDLVSSRQDIIFTISDRHPFRDDLGAISRQGSTLYSFNQRLDAFKSGKTAQFEGAEGSWLKERMPVNPEPVVPQVRPQKNAQQEKGSEELLKHQQQQDTQSTWESWKPTFKYLAAGAIAGGIGYWLYNRSWGDHHEETRKERDRIRFAAARAL